MSEPIPRERFTQWLTENAKKTRRKCNPMARVTLMPVKPNIQPSDRKPTYDGCRFSPSCLDCPLPRCKDEMTAAEIREYRRGKRREKRRERIMDAFARNQSENPGMAPFWVKWLTAHEAGVSLRTVARTLARAE